MVGIPLREPRRAFGRGGAGNGCESNRNVGPMAMAATDTREAVLQTLRELDQDARDSGWVKSRDGWVCAYCAGQLGLPKAG